MVIDKIGQNCLCVIIVLNKLYVLYAYSSQLNALLYDCCISLCMLFSMVTSIDFSHFHDVCCVSLLHVVIMCLLCFIFSVFDIFISFYDWPRSFSCHV